MENQEKLIVNVEGPEGGRVAMLAGILQILRGVGIQGAIEPRSRKAVVDASADPVQVADALARLGDRYLIELRGRDPQVGEAAQQVEQLLLRAEVAEQAGQKVEGLRRQGEKDLAELRARCIEEGERARKAEARVKVLEGKGQRVTIPVGSSPDGVASGDPEDK